MHYTGSGMPHIHANSGDTYFDHVNGWLWSHDGYMWNLMTGGAPHGLGGIGSLGGLMASSTMAVHSHWMPSMPPAPPPTSQLMANTTGSLPSPRFKRDTKVPDTMGWREWRWDAENEGLQSPVQRTFWEHDHMTAPKWDKNEVIRGVAGIHALLVPKHWKILHELGHSPNGGYFPAYVPGIVERFGKYVLGTEGWRAEQVVIRELLAPTTEIGLKLEQRYPNVIVHYPDQLEGDDKWTSEKSSKLEKGNRSLHISRPRQSNPQPSLPSRLASPSPSPTSPPSLYVPPRRSPPDPADTAMRTVVISIGVAAFAFGLVCAALLVTG